MQITINSSAVEVSGNETILELASQLGYSIPSLCYAKGAKHKSSCMVCVVKNAANGQLIPSCTTYPTEGMQIETDSEDVRLARRLSLELLLSDHRADCSALCTMVCPSGLDIEQMLWYYDAKQYQNAHAEISKAFLLPSIGCNDCKAPCEKICRRGSVDKAVSIREIIKEVAAMFNPLPTGDIKRTQAADKDIFQSVIGRFSEEEKERLKETTTSLSRCLHCACTGRASCKLRAYATAQKIKRTRYGLSSAMPVMYKQHIKDNMWFEPAKCIRCGLCVYNSNNGFTFKDRGFGMQVVLPEENRQNVQPSLAELCPTGALYNVDM